MSEHKMPLREFADRVPAHFKSTGEEHAWLAGYEAAREQAAKVCERHERHYEARDKTKMADAAGACADDIRAMTPTQEKS